MTDNLHEFYNSLNSNLQLWGSINVEHKAEACVFDEVTSVKAYPNIDVFRHLDDRNEEEGV